MNRSGLAKRMIEAAEALFVRKDAESALFSICSVIDRVATDSIGKPGGGTYRDFLHARMELITRVAFAGVGVMNWRFALKPFADERGKPIKPCESDQNGIALYSLEQVIYHLVRCKLSHNCEMDGVIRDSGWESGSVKLAADGSLSLPLASIALGLIVTLVTETNLTAELRGSVFEQVQWSGISIIELAGDSARAMAIARKETDPGPSNRSATVTQ